MAANPIDRRLARREFLGFLAASPLLTTTAATSTIASLLAGIPEKTLAQAYDPLYLNAPKLGADGLISSAAEALDVFDFEPPRRRRSRKRRRTSATLRPASTTTPRCEHIARPIRTTRFARHD